MKIQMFLCFLGLSIYGAAAATHSMKILITGSSQDQNVPEFMMVVLLDDVQMSYYDSNIRKMVPRQDWLKEIVDETFWKNLTVASLRTYQDYRADMERVKYLSNLTEGVFVLQRTYGCEWDEETGEVKSFDQTGKDGKDFLSFDLETESWTAANHEAEIMKHYLDNDKAGNAQWKNILTQSLPRLLKTSVKYGSRFLMRTDLVSTEFLSVIIHLYFSVLPSVSLLQKSSSSPVSCHATGFYPDRADLFWRRDGEEIHEGVEKGQILPNNDGTFQMSVDLQLQPEAEMHRYECVFQLSGAKEDVITELEKEQINTNEGVKSPSESPSRKIITGVVVVAVVVAAVAVAAVILYYRKNAKCPTITAATTEVQLQMLPSA